MKKLLLMGAAILAATCGFCAPLVRAGDTVVLIGDSITYHGYVWKGDGYYHLMKAAVPQATWIPLGFSGQQVRTWAPEIERGSVNNPKLWTPYRDPGWSVKAVLDGKVDVLVIFLGMNDILRPTVSEKDADLDKWIDLYRKFVQTLDTRCKPRQFVFATITPLTADPLSPKNIVRKEMGRRLRALAREFPKAVVADFGEAVAEGIEETQEIDASYKLVPDFVHPDKLGHLYMAKALSDALELDDAEDHFEDEIEARLEKMEAARRGRINLRVNAVRTTAVTDKTYTYKLDFSVCDVDDDEIKVRPILPTGWTADKSVVTDDEGAFVIRGLPTARTTRLGVEVILPGGTRKEFIDLPAPWRVKDESGKWLFYTASNWYTGGAQDGSIDPFQLWFGNPWVNNTITASRRVWSEKARDVKAILSHQTFSATLTLQVAFDGQEVWKTNLNRSGKNREEKTLHLKEGWNAIDITATTTTWQRQFAFTLEPLEGDTLNALKFSIEQ